MFGVAPGRGQCLQRKEDLRHALQQQINGVPLPTTLDALERDMDEWGPRGWSRYFVIAFPSILSGHADSSLYQRLTSCER